MTRRLPWRTDDGFPVAVLSVKVDEEPTSEVVEADIHRLNLSVVPDWDVVDIVVEATPNGDAVVEPDSAFARVAVTATRAQLSHDMVRVGAGWQTTLRLNRHEVQGRGRLETHLHGVVDGEPHRLLGSGRTWTIDFDPRPERSHDAPSPIPMVWESFKDPSQGPPTLKAHGSSRHYLDLGLEPPVLYINTDVEKLQQLLQWDTAQTWKRDLRDALSADLAGKVWTDLAHAAFSEVESDDDGTASGPLRPTFAVVFEKIAQQMEGVADADELRAKVLEGRRDPAAFRVLISSLGPAVDALVDAVPNAERFAGRVFE